MSGSRCERTEYFVLWAGLAFAAAAIFQDSYWTQKMFGHERIHSTFMSAVCLLGLFCLWDYETIQMEKVRFPGAAELIAGEFRRHSPEFYQWRIEDRLKKIESHPDDLSLLDDLAVSYEKSGQTDLAIQTMLDKDKRQPGLYETHANLGTFYIHDGQLEKGLAEIRKAIEINPDAHFGREVYQQYLVEYLIASRNEDGQLHLPLDNEIAHYQPTGFATFVVKKEFPEAAKVEYVGSNPEYRKAMEPAIKGVLGMMRFGNFDSPILLEAFAHLVMFNEDQPKQLAARALVKASWETSDVALKEKYLAMANEAIEMQARADLKDIEIDLRQEIQAGDDYFAGITENEKSWIAAGKDVEAEYAKVYFHEPSDLNFAAAKRSAYLKRFMPFFFIGLVFIGGWAFIKYRRAK